MLVTESSKQSTFKNVGIRSFRERERSIVEVVMKQVSVDLGRPRLTPVMVRLAFVDRIYCLSTTTNTSQSSTTGYTTHTLQSNPTRQELTQHDEA